MWPRNSPPIWAGSGWVYRTPSAVITTTKSVPVRDAPARRAAAGARSGPGRRARPAVGDSASVWATASTCSAVVSRSRWSLQVPRRRRPRPRRRPRSPAAGTAAAPGSMRARAGTHEMYGTVTPAHGADPSAHATAAAPASAPRPSGTAPTISIWRSSWPSRSASSSASSPPTAAKPRPARHRLRQPDQDDDHPGHLLHDRPGHRLDPPGREGRQGRRLALGYFLMMSTVALAIGLVVGNIIHPGAGLHLDAASPGRRTRPATAPKSTAEFLLGIIPETLLSSLTGDRCCRPCWWRCWSVSRCRRWAGGRTGAARDRHIQRLVFRILAMIMWLAPIGAFGAIAAVVGATGVDALKSLGQIMLGFYLTCALFVFIILGLLLRTVAGQHLPAAALSRTRVPADRVHLVVGVGAAAADREDGALRREQGRSSASPCRPATPSTSTARRST